MGTNPTNNITVASISEIDIKDKLCQDYFDLLMDRLAVFKALG
jgi:hypothetical protein